MLSREQTSSNWRRWKNTAISQFEGTWRQHGPPQRTFWDQTEASRVRLAFHNQVLAGEPANCIDNDLERFFNLCTMNTPTDENVASFTKWMDAVKPLIEGESQFFKSSDDLITTIRDAEEGFLEEGVESIVRRSGIGQSVRLCLFPYQTWLINRLSSWRPRFVLRHFLGYWDYSVDKSYLERTSKINGSKPAILLRASQRASCSTFANWAGVSPAFDSNILSLLRSESKG